MKVLVTGNLGYIGTVLTPMLLDSGHDVVGLDSDLYRDGDFSNPPDTPTIIKDIRDIERSDLEGFEAVIHLAGISNDPLGDLNPDATYEINHRAAVHVARLAKDVGVQKFLFASSCSLYGASNDELLDENSDFNPVTPYGESKILVEQDLQELASDTFAPTYLRAGTVYGISPRLRGDLVVNNLTGYAVTTNQVFLKSDGTAWRPLVHVEDIARAYTALLEMPLEQVCNEAFNVGRSGENYQIRDVANQVSEVTNCEVQFAAGASADKRCYNVDFSKLEQTVPGYQPQWNLRAGIEQIYRAYLEFGLTEEAFLGTKFLRINCVKERQANGELDLQLCWVSNSVTS